LLGGDLKLVISAGNQVIITRIHADIWPWETQVYPLGLTRRQPIRVELIRAALIAHAQAGEIRIWSELDKRTLHLAPVAYRNCK
jgi:hypothetical protein